MILDETRPARERVVFRNEHTLTYRAQYCDHCAAEIWGASVYARLVVCRNEILEVRRYCSACL